MRCDVHCPAPAQGAGLLAGVAATTAAGAMLAWIGAFVPPWLVYVLGPVTIFFVVQAVRAGLRDNARWSGVDPLDEAVVTAETRDLPRPEIEARPRPAVAEPKRKEITEAETIIGVPVNDTVRITTL